MSDEALEVENNIRQWGHIIRSDLYDDADDDVQRQCCKLYAQADMLALRKKKYETELDRQRRKKPPRPVEAEERNCYVDTDTGVLA